MRNKANKTCGFNPFVVGKLKYLLTVIILLLAPLSLCHGEAVPKHSSISEKTMELINNAVFEVVTPKPTHDSLSYEKPLPLDLIPYSIRTDKYYSIGTAFAISPDRFVSASHVMNLDVLESQYEEVYLRDRKGNIYGIDKIIGYSDHRDFVIFSLKGKSAKHYFEVSRKPSINEKVYAVGNALGEGIILREGLYTSNTPEEVNGEWKWMRFSAAASPGNSGGPLLDRGGKVIGIVLGKSENENLNYALPITEALDAKAKTAVSYKKVKYVIENMDMSKHSTFSKEFPLPLSYRSLNENLVKNFNSFSKDLLKEFLKENSQNIFPNGSGSSLLLHNIYSAVFPQIIMKDKDGTWNAYKPSDISTAELDDNGYFSYGTVADSLYVYIQKPDNISLKKFYSDSKLFMDLILKGIYLYRQVASEKVKITSLGKATDDSVFTDSYGRKWLVRAWPLEYSDEKVLAFSLPVPGGCISILKKGQTGQVNSGYVSDLKVLADFSYLSYYGTFKQWREFLSMKSLLPKIFSTIKLSFVGEKRLDFKSSRLSFSHTPAIMEVSEKSDLKLLFSYFKEKGKTVWDIRGIVVGEDKNNMTSFGIYRKSKPPKELRDKYQSGWEDIVEGKFPFNNDTYYKDGRTILNGVLAASMKPGSARIRKAPFLYTITYESEGSLKQEEMRTRLKKIKEAVNILEYKKG